MVHVLTMQRRFQTFREPPEVASQYKFEVVSIVFVDVRNRVSGVHFAGENSEVLIKFSTTPYHLLLDTI